MAAGEYRVVVAGISYQEPRWFDAGNFAAEPDADGAREVSVRQRAMHGEVVALTAAEAERLTALGAVRPADEPEPVDSDPQVADLDFATADVEEMAEWIRTARPVVSAVVDAAGDDPELAQRLLDAEAAATGGDPRKGVEAGLEAIIDARTAA